MSQIHISVCDPGKVKENKAKGQIQLCVVYPLGLQKGHGRASRSFHRCLRETPQSVARQSEELGGLA